MQLLFDKGADIESKDKDGRTPLSYAAERGHEAVVKLLLDKGTNSVAPGSHFRQSSNALPRTVPDTTAYN